MRRSASRGDALYNAIVHHETQAAAVVAAVISYDATLPVLGLPGSAFLRRAEEAGLRAVREGFADRGYRADGTLVPRGEPGALITDPADVAERVLQLVTDGSVTAVDGTRVSLQVESVCLHGDTAGAVDLARAVRARLEDDGVTVAPFAA